MMTDLLDSIGRERAAGPESAGNSRPRHPLRWRVGKVLDGTASPVSGATFYHQNTGIDDGYFFDEVDPSVLATFRGSASRDMDDAYQTVYAVPHANGGAAGDDPFVPLPAGAFFEFVEVEDGVYWVMRPMGPVACDDLWIEINDDGQVAHRLIDIADMGNNYAEVTFASASIYVNGNYYNLCGLRFDAMGHAREWSPDWSNWYDMPDEEPPP